MVETWIEFMQQALEKTPFSDSVWVEDRFGDLRICMAGLEITISPEVDLGALWEIASILPSLPLDIERPKGATPMTDPTNTPPVGQPPVAEMSEATIFAIIHEEALSDIPYVFTEHQSAAKAASRRIATRSARRIADRLAQARSAPPSEGMVLPTRSRLVDLWNSAGGRSVYVFLDRMVELGLLTDDTPEPDWVGEPWSSRPDLHLAAPSGGPDVE